MPRRSVVYDDFSGGEFGSLGHSAPPHSFTGTNMVRYLDGAIGPRSGLKALAISGLPAGLVTGLGAATSVGGTSKYYVVIGTGVYQISEAGGAAVAYAGSLAAAPSNNWPISEASDASNFTYITVPGDRTYNLNHVSPAVTALTGSPGGTAMEIHGDRMVIAGGTVTPANRLVFSAAGDYNSWPVRNYISVGDTAAIYAFAVSRYRLLIAKTYSWYMLTGVPGVSDSVRRVVNAPFEFLGAGPRQAARLPNGLVGFIPSYEDFPAIFTTPWRYGPSYAGLRHLSLGTGYVQTEAFGRPFMAMNFSPPRDELVMMVGNRALVQLNHAWTRHDLGVSLPENWLSVPPGMNSNGHVLVCDGGRASSVANFWLWELGDSMRPPISGQAFESLGDGSATAFDAHATMPEWYDPTGADVRVDTVIVDFTRYSNGSAQNNHFDVTVTALRRYEASPQDSVSLKPYDQAPSGGTSGTRDRYQINLGDQGRGAGFQVALTGVRGVKIHRITALCDVGSVGGR